jgi:hypothetical protein
MKKQFFSSYFSRRSGQRGEILLATLIFVLLGFLVVVPLLSLMGTGLKTGRVYNQKAATLYAADAGIEDAIWQIKYDQLSGKFSTYDPYDYDSTWSYSLPQENGKPQINNQTVNITLKNNWVLKNISVPNLTTASAIINNSKLMVTGGPFGSSSYNIVITYTPSPAEILKINTIGIWLPPGYNYKPNSCNLSSEPVTSGYQGGQAVVWSFSAINFTTLPGANPTDTPMTAKVTFNYTPSTTLSSSASAGSTSINVAATTGFPNSGTLSLPNESIPTTYTGLTANSITGIPSVGSGSITVSHSSGETVGLGSKPEAVSWINTTNVSGLSYTWDDTVRIFHITSTAADTTVETYIAKSELKKGSGALGGDYYATGNSLMIDADHDSAGIRERKQDSSATVGNSNIPANASLAEAYMYWASWYQVDGAAGRMTNLYTDDCSKYQLSISPYTVYWDKSATTGWTIGTLDDSTYFRATGSNYADGTDYRQLTQHAVYDINNPVYPVSAGWLFTLSWEQWYSGTTPTSTDGLDFAISSDNGTTWSNRLPAFRGANVGSSGYACAASFKYNIPSTYVSDFLKIKFYSVGFNVSNQYINIDNIRINALNPDTSVTFKIDDGISGYRQVYLDSAGQPQIGASELTASQTQVVLTYTYNSGSSPTPRGFAYSCYRDITSLVEQYSLQPTTPATNLNAHGAYWVKGDLGDTGTSTTYYQQAHAGWSIIFIYASPETLGHQLYLYDGFTGSGYTGSGYVNVDFDRDGQPGGTISGFVMPTQVQNDDGSWEINAAKLTCFVTEGDNGVTGDYLAIKDTSASSYTKLWDGTTSTSNSKSSPNNVWNGKSVGISGDGIDIDTLGLDPPNGQYITWASNILKPGDTVAYINLMTQNDYFFLVYMIFSFRSEVTTGGSLSYLIRG